MRWRITIRGDDCELRGYIDAALADIERLAEAVRPLGMMIGSPADPDYDPFRKAPPNEDTVTSAGGTPVGRREGSQPSNESTTERSTRPGPSS